MVRISKTTRSLLLLLSYSTTGETTLRGRLSSDQSHLKVTFLGPAPTAGAATIAAKRAATGGSLSEGIRPLGRHHARPRTPKCRFRLA